MGGYGVLQASRARAENTMEAAAPPPPAPVDSLVPLARFTNAYEAPDRSHLIPSWGPEDSRWDWSGCWDDLLAQDALQAERRRNLLAQPLDASETPTAQSQDAQTAASDAKLDPKQVAERILHQQAKNLILTLYAQSQYVKARSRLQRGRGIATESAEPMHDMSAVEKSLAAVRRLGLDPIQVLKTGGFNTKQIQLVLDASRLCASAAATPEGSTFSTDEVQSASSEAGSPVKEPEELFQTPRTGSPLSPHDRRQPRGELGGDVDGGLLADVRQVKTYLPSIQGPGKLSPPLLIASPSPSKQLLLQRAGSPNSFSSGLGGKSSPQLLSMPNPNSPLALARGAGPRTSCEGSIRSMNRGGLLGSSLSSSPLKSRWASESGAANPGRADLGLAAAPGRADIALPPVALMAQGSIRGHLFSPAKLLARGASKDRFASLGLKPPSGDPALGIGLQ